MNFFNKLRILTLFIFLGVIFIAQKQIGTFFDMKLEKKIAAKNEKEFAVIHSTPMPAHVLSPEEAAFETFCTEAEPYFTPALENIPHLLRLLDCRHTVVRRRASMALGKIGAPAAYDVARRLSETGRNSFASWELIVALSLMGEPAISSTQDLLYKSSDDTRIQAVQVFNEMTTRAVSLPYSVKSKLEDLAKNDPNADVRRNAEFVLKRLPQ